MHWYLVTFYFFEFFKSEWSGMKYDGIGVYSIQFHHHLLFFLPSNSSIRLLYFICSHVFFYSASMFHHLLPCVPVYIVDSLLQCYKNRTGRSDRSDREPEGWPVWFECWIGHAVRPVGTAQNRCTRFFFSAKSFKTTSFCIFF
jgi:hypothetical protein